jgi:chromosome segregation ATPase
MINAAKKFAEENAKFVADDQSVIMLEKAFVAGYQLATDGRELVDINFLKNLLDAEIKKTTAIQSSLKEKEKEISGYKKVIELKNDEITGYKKELKEKEKECEELKQHHTDWLEATERGDKLFQSHHKKELEELKAENEKLKAVEKALIQETNDLRMDNMTHEYNEAEGIKFAPEMNRQLVTHHLKNIREGGYYPSGDYWFQGELYWDDDAIYELSK